MCCSYLKYILRHKWFVLVECFKQGLFWQGITHDMSKLLPSEFKPYMEWFYGEYGYKFNGGCGWKPEYANNQICGEKFDKAWLFHQHRNPHHWQYWVLRNDSGTTEIIEMPYKYAVEMVCDWKGAGKAINGKNDLKEWYQKNKDKILLHKTARDCIEWKFKELRQ